MPPKDAPTGPQYAASILPVKIFAVKYPAILAVCVMDFFGDFQSYPKGYLALLS
jgi:hypothetical protein